MDYLIGPNARDDVVLNYERRICRHRTTKVSRGSAAGATTMIDASALSSALHLDDDRRFSIKLEETFEVEMVHNDDKCYFHN